MRAAQLVEYGAPLEVREVERPEPRKRDVLIEVRAAAVNPIDWKIAAGTQRAFIRLTLPWTLGMDVSGVVVDVGEKVQDFEVGDEVFGVLDYKRPGTCAEYVLADEKIVADKPPSLDHPEAAALPLAGLTAWQAIVDAGRVSDGDEILIQAGAGGVGTLAIQIAAVRGARIATTCSPRNDAMVRELGADQTIDYRETDIEDVLSELDMVLDSIGGRARWAALDVLRRGGRHVSIVSDIPALVAQHGATLGALRAVGRLGRFKVQALVCRGVISKMVVMKPRRRDLEALSKLVERGELRPIIDSTFALDDAEAAHERSRSHHAQGKIVVVP